MLVFIVFMILQSYRKSNKSSQFVGSIIDISQARARGGVLCKLLCPIHFHDRVEFALGPGDTLCTFCEADLFPRCGLALRPSKAICSGTALPLLEKLFSFSTLSCPYLQT